MCLVNLLWSNDQGGRIMGNTKRRKLELKLPNKRSNCFVDLDSGQIFEDEEKKKEITTKNLTTLKVSIPKDIRFFEVRKSMFSPIGALAMNSNIWPIKGAISLTLFLDNREIDMIENGEFRKSKYNELCNALTWKRWMLLVYTFEDRSKKAILWWNNRV